MSVSRLRLVSVDVTNTLIRVHGSPGKQYAYVASKFGIEADGDVLTSVFLQKYKQFNAQYPNFGLTVNMPANVWWSNLVKECFRTVDSGLDEATLDKVANSLYFHYTTPFAWEFLPGAFDAIKDLRRYPVKTAVISNWDHRLYKLLYALKLRTYFDSILPSYVIGVEKPDPAIFLQALQDAECKPEEAVHFGDNIEKDFIGARNVGMDSYLLSSPAKKSDFLDQNFVVPNVQSFIDAIRPRLGDPSKSVPETNP